jgi:broad specificity phosphatase PhoE
MNAQVRFRGIRDVPLNDVGRAEAREAARALKNSGLAAVYSSPLGRAREVARRIALVSNVPQVHDLPQLLNLHYGAWEGLTKQECADRDPRAWALYADQPEEAFCPDGEALASAADRILEAFRILGERHPGQSVAAVSHGVMLRLAVLRVQGAPASGWQFKVPTGSALEFLCGPDGVSLVTTVTGAPVDPHKNPAVRLHKAG